MRSALAQTLAWMLLYGAVCWGANDPHTGIDGPVYSGFACSLETGKYYKVEVAFRDKRAYLSLARGGKLILVLQADGAEDSEEILAVDGKGDYWALYLDGIDELGNGNQVG